MAAQTVSDNVLAEMIDRSVAVKAQSYSPYSKFRVGAALLSQDGTIFTGCNVENVSYTPGVCAERSAVVKAISEGHRRFVAVVISSDMESFLYPCGVCRQTLLEFCDDMDVYVTKPDKTFLKLRLADLLPGPQAAIKDSLMH